MEGRGLGMRGDMYSATGIVLQGGYPRSVLEWVRFSAAVAGRGMIRRGRARGLSRIAPLTHANRENASKAVPLPAAGHEESFSVLLRQVSLQCANLNVAVLKRCALQDAPRLGWAQQARRDTFSLNPVPGKYVQEIRRGILPRNRAATTCEFIARVASCVPCRLA